MERLSPREGSLCVAVLRTRLGEELRGDQVRDCIDLKLCPKGIRSLTSIATRMCCSFKLRLNLALRVSGEALGVVESALPQSVRKMLVEGQLHSLRALSYSWLVSAGLELTEGKFAYLGVEGWSEVRSLSLATDQLMTISLPNFPDTIKSDCNRIKFLNLKPSWWKVHPAVKNLHVCALPNLDV